MESLTSNDYDVYRDSGKPKQHVFGIHRLFQKIQGLSAVCLGGPHFRLGPEAYVPCSGPSIQALARTDCKCLVMIWMTLHK